jgi:ribonuclease HI
MIYCDSSIEPFNPDGILAWAFIAKKKGEVVHQDVHISGWGKGTTNNQGEYQAVLGALLWLVSLPKDNQLPAVIHSDSQLVIYQCAGSWGCHDEKLQKLLALVNRARDKYKKSIFFKWIPREKNTEADALSRTLYTPEAIEVMKKHKMDIIFEDDDLPF